MNQKVLLMLLILGIISAGTATYALFNGDMLLDVTNDVSINNSSLQNNQSDIQNNLSNIQNNQSNIKSNHSNNVANGENLSLGFNDVANSVLNNKSVVNNNSVEKVVKEVLRIVANDGLHIYYDDSSGIVIRGNRTLYYKHVLTPIYDTDNLSGGYIICADCGKFIPIGDVPGLVPENYSCKCPDEHPKSVKEVTFVYSEENILEAIKVGLQPCSGSPTGYAEIPVDDTLSDDSANMDNGDSNSSSTLDYNRVPSESYLDSYYLRKMNSDGDDSFDPTYYQGMHNFGPNPLYSLNTED